MIDASPALPRAALSRTLTILLAGGPGIGLHELTARVSMAALPLFATYKGPLRLVDFTMANAVRSGLSHLLAITQHRPDGLTAHLDRHWAPLFPGGGLAVRSCDAGDGGIGQAIAAHRHLIDAADPAELLVLAADHICQADFSAMVAAHRASGATVTLSVLEKATVSGGVVCDPEGRITDYGEPLSGGTHASGRASVSTGAWLFDWPWLRDRLPANSAPVDVIPPLIAGAVAAGTARAHALPGQDATYWRQVDTLDSLRETLIDLVAGRACTMPVLPGTPFRLAGLPAANTAGETADLIDSILLPGARAMPGARLNRTILAPGTVVPGDLDVGTDPVEDARWFRRTEGGTTLITNAMLARRAGRALSDLQERLRTALGTEPSPVAGPPPLRDAGHRDG